MAAHSSDYDKVPHFDVGDYRQVEPGVEMPTAPPVQAGTPTRDFTMLYRRNRDGVVVKVAPPPKSGQFASDTYLRAVRDGGAQYSIWSWKDFLENHAPLQAGEAVPTNAPPVDTLIAETRRICEAATEGPWTVMEENGAEQTIRARGKIVGGVIATVHTDWIHEPQRIQQRANTDFIAHSRTALPALCDALDQSRSTIREQAAEIERLRRFVEWCLQESSWQGCDLDGGDMQDKAQEMGFIVEVPATAELREEWDCDTMFEVVWNR